MFSRILHKARHFVNTAQQRARNNKMINTMAEKLQAMKHTMDNTTPKAFALLFILSTIPSFYFVQQMFQNDYNTDEYIQYAHNSVKYFYLKNFILYGSSAILYKMNFRNPSSKFTLERRPVKYLLAPIILGFVGIMLPPADSKHIIWPAFVTDLFTGACQLQLTNQGIIPFWFYSYRHYIRFFDWIILVIVYQSLKKYRQRRESHPHEFVKEVTSQEAIGVKEEGNILKKQNFAL